MKQTAVEWFFKQLTEVNYECINKTFLQNNNSLAGYKLRELLEQAKAMDKEQIKGAQMDMFNHINQNKFGLDYLNKRDAAEEYAEQYYNETFKSE